MTIDRAGRTAAVSSNSFADRAEAIADRPDALVDPQAIEFVRFCYQRRRVSWPDLYDDMCAVAARGAFHGMAYDELEELGITFAVTGLPRLVSIAERVVAEERSHSPRRSGRGNGSFHGGGTPHAEAAATIAG